jgi:hypothetical protein
VFSNHERYFWPPDGGTLAPLRVVDNQSWYEAMNIVDFLSTVGRYFRIGTSFLAPAFVALLWIRDILVRIRIRGSVPLANGSGSCYFLP